MSSPCPSAEIHGEEMPLDYISEGKENTLSQNRCLTQKGLKPCQLSQRGPTVRMPRSKRESRDSTPISVSSEDEMSLLSSTCARSPVGEVS